MSINNLSAPVRLEQLAEECAELGHAALKLARTGWFGEGLPLQAVELHGVLAG